MTLIPLLAGGFGITSLLPHQPEPDAYPVRQAEVLAGREEPAPSFYFYPLLQARLGMLLPLSDAAQAPLAPAQLPRHRGVACIPWVRMRWISVLAHAASVLTIFGIARRLLDRRWSLFAAALAATALVPSLYAVQGRPHLLAMATAGGGLWLALRLAERPSPTRYAAAGLGLLFAAGSLHSGWLVALALLAAHGHARRSPHRPHHLWLGLALSLGLLAIPAFYPSWSGIAPPSGIEPAGLPRLEDGALFWGRHELSLQRFAAAHPTRWVALLWMSEPVLAVLSGLGLVLFLLRWMLAGRRCARPAPHSATPRGLLPPPPSGLQEPPAAACPRRRAARILAAHALAYALVLSLYGHAQDRYLLPLYPSLAILAADALARLGSNLRLGPGLAACAGAACLVLPASALLHLSQLRQRPDTVQLATRWLETHALPRAPLGIASFSIPALAQAPRTTEAAPPAWVRTQPWLHHLHERAPMAGDHSRPTRLIDLSRIESEQDVRALLAELAGGYVLLEISQRTGAERPARRALEAALARQGRALADFRGSPQAGGNRFHDFGGRHQQLLGLLRQERLGPRLRIYAVPDGPLRRPRRTRRGSRPRRGATGLALGR